ncbi:MAG: FHIPEP family type III secretion protein, partial [Pseudomonadota bacterium]
MNVAKVPLRSFSFGANIDIGISLGIVGILMVMIIPLPTMVLDILLAFNITLSIMILLLTIYAVRPLDFSVFPSLLLITTLFRLSLNIASTRLILLNGQSGVLAAGKIISSFGSFVVGGNPTVGLVVFVILVIINFVVITKGSGRIAEVAARFTLDAMPGKQMSIDADLNAGLIDETAARSRRAQISREAEFYGAMDGASKFVRGDAIAGILITMINILGGLVIGILQMGLDVSTAVQNYTLLTIGDGLVSQIPALV